MKHSDNCKLFKNILNGLFCWWCNSEENTQLQLNEQYQLIFKCRKCRREWI